MAAITSNASGNWLSTSTWVGGVVPTSADTVTIAAAHTVTLDGDCAALSVTLNGILSASQSVSSKLTLQKGLVCASTPQLRRVDIDLSADPAIKCDLLVNASASATAADTLISIMGLSAVTLKGYPRQRIARLVTPIVAGVSTSCTVSDASGWQVGDIISFATTSDYANVPAVDDVVLTSISGNDIAWSGAVTYAHAVDGYVGNFTSNVRFAPGVANASSVINKDISYAGTPTIDSIIDNVMFDQAGSAAYPYFGSFFWGAGGDINTRLTVSNSAWWKPPATIGGPNFGGVGTVNIDGIIVRGTTITAGNSIQVAVRLGGSLLSHPIARRIGIFGAGCTGANSGYCGISLNGSDIRLSESFASGCGSTVANPQSSSVQVNTTGAGFTAYGVENYITNCDTFGNKVGLSMTTGTAYVANLRNGYYSETGASSNSISDNHFGVAKTVVTDSKIASVSNSNLSTQADAHTTTYINKNRDSTQQEVYVPYAAIKRDDATKNRGLSSISIKPSRLSTDSQRTLSIPCGNGKTIRVIGYVKADTAFYNGGNWNAPTVTISGLGITPVTFTASSVANNAWEEYDLSATNNAGYDGNLTLTYSVNAKAVATGTVYFDGVPDAPFVTKVRHYGFTFDESNPVRVPNPVTQATEAVAAAYAGVTINSATPQITVGAGTVDTFRKLYDQHQAWACLNIDKDVLLTSTDGVNFSAALTTKISWPAMGTDGILSGGWLLLSAGTHTYKLSGTKIDCTTAGTYNMSSTVFSGTVELVNSSGGAVTIQMPNGVSYTNTGPNINVTAPSSNTILTISAPVSLVGAEVRVYDLDNIPAGSLGTELAGTESCPTSTFTYSGPAGNTIYVQVMLAGYVEYGTTLVMPASDFTLEASLTTDTFA